MRARRRKTPNDWPLCTTAQCHSRTHTVVIFARPWYGCSTGGRTGHRAPTKARHDSLTQGTRRYECLGTLTASVATGVYAMHCCPPLLCAALRAAASGVARAFSGRRRDRSAIVLRFARLSPRVGARGGWAARDARLVITACAIKTARGSCWWIMTWWMSRDGAVA